MATLPSSSSGKITKAASIPYRVVKQISDVLFLLQHRDSRRRRTVIHFDSLKPCVTLPEATPLEEIAVQQDEDQGTTPSLLTHEEATTTEPLEGNDE